MHYSNSRIGTFAGLGLASSLNPFACPQDPLKEGNRTMTRFIRSLLLSAAACITPIASSLFALPAMAQTSHDLCQISDEYRNAALGFERHAYRAKYFDSYDERLADRLENVAREFRSAARNPKDVQRLLYHWQDLAATHFRVEEMLVRAHAGCDPKLLRCWQPVAETFTCLAEEMKYFTNPIGRVHDHAGNSQPTFDPFGNGTGYRQQPSEYGARPPFPSRETPNGYIDQNQMNQNQFDARFRQTPFGIQPNFGSDRPVNQIRPSVPAYPSRQSVQVNPRREIGAAIAATILNRLFN